MLNSKIFFPHTLWISLLPCGGRWLGKLGLGWEGISKRVRVASKTLGPCFLGFLPMPTEAEWLLQPTAPAPLPGSWSGNTCLLGAWDWDLGICSTLLSGEHPGWAPE